jgi:hypothetical protein
LPSLSPVRYPRRLRALKVLPVRKALKVLPVRKALKVLPVRKVPPAV